MEATYDLKEIQLILDKLVSLLMSVEETNWLQVMRIFRERSELAESEEIKNLLCDIARIYGGMGSFNDLILYKNGDIMIEETSCLDNLRTSLYEKVMTKRFE